MKIVLIIIVKNGLIIKNVEVIKIITLINLITVIFFLTNFNHSGSNILTISLTVTSLALPDNISLSTLIDASIFKACLIPNNILIVLSGPMLLIKSETITAKEVTIPSKVLGYILVINLIIIKLAIIDNGCL